MSILLKIPAILYRMYDDKGNHSPYFDAILTIVIVLFLHAVHIGLLLNLPSSYIMPWSSGSSRPSQWLFGAIYFGLIIAIICIIFKKSNLEKVEVSEKQIAICRKVLPIYLAACIVLLTVLLIKKGVEQGKIHM